MINFFISKFTNTYEVPLTASHSAPCYLKKLRFSYSEKTLGIAEKENIKSSLVAYKNSAPYNYTPSYCSRINKN